MNSQNTNPLYQPPKKSCKVQLYLLDFDASKHLTVQPPCDVAVWLSSFKFQKNNKSETPKTVYRYGS